MTSTASSSSRFRSWIVPPGWRDRG
jgi:hypothetical protein